MSTWQRFESPFWPIGFKLAAIFLVFALIFVSKCAAGATPPCDTSAPAEIYSACLERSLLEQVYQNEALKQQNATLQRMEKSAENLAAAEGSRANKYEKKAADVPSRIEWFTLGSLAGTLTAILLYSIFHK